VLDPTNNIEDKDYYIISQQGVDILTWDYFLHLIIIILIINVMVFLLMIYLSEYNLIKKLPYGDHIFLILSNL
jgi:hypothetical protein